jgi:hypothetical protein
MSPFLPSEPQNISDRKSQERSLGSATWHHVLWLQGHFPCEVCAIKHSVDQGGGGGKQLNYVPGTYFDRRRLPKGARRLKPVPNTARQHHSAGPSWSKSLRGVLWCMCARSLGCSLAVSEAAAGDTAHSYLSFVQGQGGLDAAPAGSEWAASMTAKTCDAACFTWANYVNSGTSSSGPRLHRLGDRKRVSQRAVEPGRSISRPNGAKTHPAERHISTDIDMHFNRM